MYEFYGVIWQMNCILEKGWNAIFKNWHWNRRSLLL